MNGKDGDHEQQVKIALIINQEPWCGEVPVRRHLADVIRLDAGLTGTHLGCEQGVCGACSVLVDGTLVRSCTLLAVQANGCAVMTAEGLADLPEGRALQRAFFERGALQCGFCSAAMVATAIDLLREGLAPTREAIRQHLAGNYCRCTGYEAIVDAVEAAAAALRDGAEAL